MVPGLVQLSAVTAVLLLAVVVDRGAGWYAHTFEYYLPVAVVSATALVLSTVAAPVPGLQSVLEWAPLRWLGRRSYGLYLYHYPIFVAVGAPGGSIARVAMGTALSVAAAAASYQWIEQPFLRLKRRFEQVEVPASQNLAAPVDQ